MANLEDMAPQELNIALVAPKAGLQPSILIAKSYSDGAENSAGTSPVRSWLAGIAAGNVLIKLSAPADSDGDMANGND